MTEELEFWQARVNEYSRQLAMNASSTSLGSRRNIEDKYAVACKKLVHLSGTGKIKKKYSG